MLYERLTIFILLLCGLTTIEAAQRRFNLELYKLTCLNTTEPIQRFECDFVKLSTSNYAASGSFISNRQLWKDLRTRILITVILQNTDKLIRFLDLELNVCDLLDNPMTNQILKGLLNEFKRSSNIPVACPVKENILYEVNNFTISEKNLPPFAPFLNYTFTLELYESKRLLGVLTALGAAVPKNQK